MRLIPFGQLSTEKAFPLEDFPSLVQLPGKMNLPSWDTEPDGDSTFSTLYK